MERIRRLWCHYFGHRWYEPTEGRPVVDAWLVCFRCGKWARFAREPG